MDILMQFFHNYGALGLFLLSFTESIFSPILPDLLLIPLALSTPEKAIHYGIVATTGSVLGGFLGYAIGKKFGRPVLKRFVPPQRLASLNYLVQKYGGWAIWFAALAPIPYKFITITAGAFRVNLLIFSIASLFGRAKRFLLAGVLIFYYGARASELLRRYSDNIFFMILLGIMVIIFIFRVIRPSQKQPSQPHAEVRPSLCRFTTDFGFCIHSRTRMVTYVQSLRMDRNLGSIFFFLH